MEKKTTITSTKKLPQSFALAFLSFLMVLSIAIPIRAVEEVPVEDQPEETTVIYTEENNEELTPEVTEVETTGEEGESFVSPEEPVINNEEQEQTQPTVEEEPTVEPSETPVAEEPTPEVTPEVTPEITPEMTPEPTPEEVVGGEEEVAEEVEPEILPVVLTGNTDKGVVITVTTDTESLPEYDEDYHLNVWELPEDSDIYKQYYDAAKEALEENKEIKHARFFDITILNVSNEEIEPKNPVQVEITYPEPLVVEENDTLDVMHFVEDNQEIVETEVIEAEVTELSVYEEGEVVVSFEQGSFSVTGTVVSTDGTSPSLSDRYYGFPTENGDYVMVVQGENGKYYALSANDLVAAAETEHQKYAGSNSNAYGYYDKNGNEIWIGAGGGRAWTTESINEIENNGGDADALKMTAEELAAAGVILTGGSHANCTDTEGNPLRQNTETLSDPDGKAKDAKASKGTLTEVTIENGKVTFPDSFPNDLIDDQYVFQYVKGFNTFGGRFGDGNYMTTKFGDPLGGWRVIREDDTSDVYGESQTWYNDGRVSRSLFWVDENTSPDGWPAGLYASDSLMFGTLLWQQNYIPSPDKEWMTEHGIAEDYFYLSPNDNPADIDSVGEQHKTGPTILGNGHFYYDGNGNEILIGDGGNNAWDPNDLDNALTDEELSERGVVKVPGSHANWTKTDNTPLDPVKETVVKKDRTLTGARLWLDLDNMEWHFGDASINWGNSGEDSENRISEAGSANTNGYTSPTSLFFSNDYGTNEPTPGDEPKDDNLDKPYINKSISPNNATIEGESGDGTYTLSLNINGTAKDIYEHTKADVLIILDTSNSMAFPQTTLGGEYVSSPDRRYDAAQTALNDLIDSLFELNEIDPELLNVNMFDFAGVTMRKDNSQWTSDKTVLKNFISGDNGPLKDRVNGDGEWMGDPSKHFAAVDGVTNWEDALIEAIDSMNNNANRSADDNVKKYVIFITDGNPTVSNTKNDENSESHKRGQRSYATPQAYNRAELWGNGAEEPENIWYAFQQAKDNAKEIVDNDIELYTIGIYGGGGLLKNLLAYAYSGDEVGTYPDNHYFDAQTTEQMQEAFKKIASKIEGNMNFTDVKIEDGITDLTSAALDTEPEAFVYYKWLEDGNRNIYDTEDVHEDGYVKRYDNATNRAIEPDSIDVFGNPVYTQEQLDNSYLPPAKYIYKEDANNQAYYIWQLDEGVYYGPKGDDGEHSVVFDEDEALKIYNIYEKMDEDKARWDLKDKVRDFSGGVDTSTWKEINVTPATYDQEARKVIWNMNTVEPYTNRAQESVNDYVLGKNWTYAVTFPVWPSQEMYDHVAEWNNYDNTTGDNQENLDSFASDKSSDPEVSKYVEQGEEEVIAGQTYHKYTLLTNVEDSAKATYSQMNQKTTMDGGETVTEVVKLDPNTIPYNKVPPIIVCDTQIKVTKYWEDLLDTTKLAQLIEQDPNFEVEMILLQATHDQDGGTAGEVGPDGKMSYGPLYDEESGTWPTEYIYPHNPSTPYTPDDDYEGAFKILLKPIYHYYGSNELINGPVATVSEYYASKGENAPDETDQHYDHNHVVVDGFQEGQINLSVGLMISNPDDFGDASTLGNPEEGYVEYVVTYPAGAPLPDGTWATTYGWAFASQEELDAMGKTKEDLWADGYIVSASDRDTGEYVKGFPGNTLNGVDRRGSIGADGSVTVHYYLLDEGYHYMLRETNRDYAFTLDAQVYHPFLIDGVLYDINCDYENNTGVVVSHVKDYNKTGNDTNSYWLKETGLSATNKLRPHITLEKIILDGNNRYYYQKNEDGTVKTEGVYAPEHEGDDAYKTTHKIRPDDEFDVLVMLDLPEKITNLGRINFAKYPEWYDQLVEEGKWSQDEADSAINHLPKVQSFPDYTFLINDETGDVIAFSELTDEERAQYEHSKPKGYHYYVYGSITLNPNERVRVYNVPVGTKVSVFEDVEKMYEDYGDKYELAFFEVDWADRQDDGSYGQANNWYYGTQEVLDSLNESKEKYPDAAYPENGWTYRNPGEVDDEGNQITGITSETIEIWDINYDIDVFNYFRPNVEMKKVDGRRGINDPDDILELDDETDPVGTGKMVNDAKVKGLEGAKFTLYREVLNDELAEMTDEEKEELIETNSNDYPKGVKDNVTDLKPLVIVTSKIHKNDGSYEEKRHEDEETDDLGKIDFGYLRDGFYYLVETKAPSGYNLDDRPTKITVGINMEDEEAVKYQKLGTPTAKVAWSRTEYATDSSVEKKIFEIAIEDDMLYTLPSAGGIGTYYNTILGTMVMAIGAYYIAMNRKRKRGDVGV